MEKKRLGFSRLDLMIALNGFSAGALTAAIARREPKLLISSLFLFTVTLVEIYLELKEKKVRRDAGAEDIEVV